MSTTTTSNEELVKTFQQVLKKYNSALTENTEFENLKRLYVELRELKWKILEFNHTSQYNAYMVS